MQPMLWWEGGSRINCICCIHGVDAKKLFSIPLFNFNSSLNFSPFEIKFFSRDQEHSRQVSKSENSHFGGPSYPTDAFRTEIFWYGLKLTCKQYWMPEKASSAQWPLKGHSFDVYWATLWQFNFTAEFKLTFSITTLFNILSWFTWILVHLEPGSLRAWLTLILVHLEPGSLGAWFTWSYIKCWTWENDRQIVQLTVV